VALERRLSLDESLACQEEGCQFAFLPKSRIKKWKRHSNKGLHLSFSRFTYSTTVSLES